MLMYNPEDKTYSKFITIEEMAEVQEKIKQIEERLLFCLILFYITILK